MALTTDAVELKNAQEIGWMREAGRIVAETLAVLSEASQPGVSTGELDRIAESEIRKRKGKPAFIGYRGFPATLCASINDEVVHGIPSPKRILKNGDLLSLDLGAIVRGYYGDAAVTVPIGTITAKARKLMDTTRLSLEKAIEAVRPGARLGDVSAAVQSCVEAEGFGVVREFVGHGIGRSLHEEPAVPNYGKAGTGRRLAPGLVIAIEPMITMGSFEVKVLSDGWTAVTADGSLAAHFEHTIAVTEDGSEVLTKL
jgi:methionyl aminopeptidase